MEPTAAAAAMSILCLFISFDLCYGIKCYMCFASNLYPNPKCETIQDDEYLLDYKDHADQCVKIIYMYRNRRGRKIRHRTLRRYGHPSDGYIDLHREVTKMSRRGFKIDAETCREDKCNDW